VSSSKTKEEKDKLHRNKIIKSEKTHKSMVSPTRFIQVKCPVAEKRHHVTVVVLSTVRCRPQQKKEVQKEENEENPNNNENQIHEPLRTFFSKDFVNGVIVAQARLVVIVIVVGK
jgi:hypothetical protein